MGSDPDLGKITGSGSGYEPDPDPDPNPARCSAGHLFIHNGKTMLNHNTIFLLKIFVFYLFVFALATACLRILVHFYTMSIL